VNKFKWEERVDGFTMIFEFMSLIIQQVIGIQESLFQFFEGGI